MRWLPSLWLLCIAWGCVGPAPTPCTECAGVCVDLKTDEKNCGMCGKACAAGSVCTNGVCGVTCPSSQMLCAGACVDTGSSPAHCGGCGNACAAEQFCNMGTCSPIAPCGSAQKRCSGVCTSVQTDQTHCGDCGNACSAGKVCQSGTCSTTCGPNLQTCAADGGSQCADTRVDPENCGGCGRKCTAAEGCFDGTCKTLVTYPPRVCGQLPRQPDGGLGERQTLYANRLDAPFRALCSRDGGTYLELPVDGGTNFTRRPGNASLTIGPDVTSTYRAVRIDYDVARSRHFISDRFDLTYATSVGQHEQQNTNGDPYVMISSVPYGEANACTTTNANPGTWRGISNLTLVGTPFAIGDVTFVAGGYMPHGQVTYSQFRQVADLRGDGFCGAYFPSAPIPLVPCPQPSDERCDREDNNCDGLVDNLADAGLCP